MSDTQFLSDFLGRGVPAFKGKSRRACSYVQTGNLLQHRQQLFANAIGEILAPLVVAEIVESQHRDRLGADWRRLCFSRRLSSNRLLWLRFGPDQLEDKQARGNNSQHHGEADELPSS